MKKSITHQKRLLLVEDLEEFYVPILRWLKEEGYRIDLAKNLTEALSALETEHYHLAIVDIRLKNNVSGNEDGMELLEEIEKMRLKDIMPCIVLTAYANLDNVLNATQNLQVERFIQKKAGYRKELIEAVKNVFDKKVKINFSLEYELDSHALVSEISQDINWSMGANPDKKQLVPQVYDLFGKLFFKAGRLHISKLSPGLTGAAIIKATPTYLSVVSPRVVKTGRWDKIETEYKRYIDFVKPYLPPNVTSQVEVSYTRHLGALSYQFAESDFAPLVELDEFYKSKSPEQIIGCLRNLFDHTLQFFYENPDRRFGDIPELYYDAFQLTCEKLIHRIQVIIPTFDPQHETLVLPESSIEIINPIAWLTRHTSDCQMPVYFCITHGDLTGRNVMVTERGRCWLIDFYRTYISHILRDFVILETDIKYRLLPDEDFSAGFLSLESALLNDKPLETDRHKGENFSPELEKARQTIVALRTIAFEHLRDPVGQRLATHKEYLMSLLMATLNIVRLRHIPEERKLQAMLSASMICAKLDRLGGHESTSTRFNSHIVLARLNKDSSSTISTPIVANQNAFTRQQQHLAESLRKSKLNLFIGSDVPSKKRWPSIETFAQQLMEPNNDKPPDARRLFTVYLRTVGSRGDLIERMVWYFESYKRPTFFDLIPELKWHAVYTTNQHTYLKSAYDDRQQPYHIITSPMQFSEDSMSGINIYKIYGCLSKEHHHESLTLLPLGEEDYNQIETAKRIDQFSQKIILDAREGNLLLMVYPSERELTMAHEWVRSLGESGLIWVTGLDFSEDDQDYHRHLNLRVLFDDPVELLKRFARFSQG